MSLNSVSVVGEASTDSRNKVISSIINATRDSASKYITVAPGISMMKKVANENEETHLRADSTVTPSELASLALDCLKVSKNIKICTEYKDLLPVYYYPETHKLKFPLSTRFPVVFSNGGGLDVFRSNAIKTAEAMTKDTGQTISISAVYDPGKWEGQVMEILARNGRWGEVKAEKEWEKRTAKIIQFPTQSSQKKPRVNQANTSKNEKKAWFFRGLKNEYVALMSALWKGPSGIKEWLRN